MGQGPQWTEAQRAARLSKLLERNRAQHVGPRLYEDKEWMYKAYVVRGLSMKNMSVESECGLRTIARWMRIHGIPVDPDRIRRNKRRGPDHPSWQGGPPTCVCGKELYYGSTACRKCKDVSGQNNSNWRGEDAEYTAIHGRLAATRGKPSEHPCTHCPEVAQEWAYDHADPDERRNLRGRDDGPYSLNLDHYITLCVCCHRKLDNGRRRRTSTDEAQGRNPNS